MNLGLYIVICLLLLIIAFLIIKIYIIKKSLKEIESVLNSILKSDTNALITTSSSDRYIKSLVYSLNIELKELRKQKLQYVNGNQELKKIITNVSHDLRTPLTAINGYIDLMRNEKLSQNQEKCLNIIDKKSNQLSELTEELFTFSRTMDANVKMTKENYCINELLEEVLASYYDIFKKENIKPEIKICKEKIYRNINKNSIIRVFENILSNMYKYSCNYFRVELKSDGKVVFSNKTTSLDITSVQKIFDRFFTVENAKKSNGIGLSIAKQLVELNDGNISAKYINETLIIEIVFN